MYCIGILESKIKALLKSNFSLDLSRNITDFWRRRSLFSKNYSWKKNTVLSGTTLVAIMAEMQKLQEASQQQLAEQQRQIKEQQDAIVKLFEANESKVTQDFAAFDSTAKLLVQLSGKIRNIR